MTIEEMRNRLAVTCSAVPLIKCCIGYCPLFELCDLSPHALKDKCDVDIAEMYNEAVRQGLIEEE